MTTRRNFVRGVGAAGAAGVASTVASSRASADFPVLAQGPSHYKVLELFAYGGISHRDTLWVDGDVDNEAAHRSAPDMTGGGVAGNPATQSFLSAAEGGLPYDLNVGAGVQPLWYVGAEPTMRLIAMSADVPDAHVLGAAFALRGAPIGNPAGISLGARIQYAAGPTSTPASWVIDAGKSPSTAVAASDPGSLPGSARPFRFKMGHEVAIALDRGTLAAQDSLLDLYVARYENRLDGVRSSGFSEYASSVRSAFNWSETKEMLETCHGECGSFSPGSFVHGAHGNAEFLEGIKIAGHLLKAGARHVAVIEERDVLDTHFTFAGNVDPMFAHANHHNWWIWHVCNRLVTEVLEGRISLSDTMILIHTEFGRRLDNEDGSEHHRSGYAALCLGGPIEGPSTCGYIDFDEHPTLGTAVDGATAQQLLNAVAYAAGAPTPGVSAQTLEDHALHVLGTTGAS